MADNILITPSSASNAQTVGADEVVLNGVPVKVQYVKLITGAKGTYSHMITSGGTTVSASANGLLVDLGDQIMYEAATGNGKTFVTGALADYLCEVYPINTDGSYDDTEAVNVVNEGNTGRLKMTTRRALVTAREKTVFSFSGSAMPTVLSQEMGIYQKRNILGNWSTDVISGSEAMDPGPGGTRIYTTFAINMDGYNAASFWFCASGFDTDQIIQIKGPGVQTIQFLCASTMTGSIQWTVGPQPFSPIFAASSASVNPMTPIEGGYYCLPSLMNPLAYLEVSCSPYTSASSAAASTGWWQMTVVRGA